MKIQAEKKAAVLAVTRGWEGSDEEGPPQPKETPQEVWISVYAVSRFRGHNYLTLLMFYHQRIKRELLEKTRAKSKMKDEVKQGDKLAQKAKVSAVNISPGFDWSFRS